MTEPQILNVYQKLVEVRKTVTFLQKEKEGAQYKYVASSQVLHAVREKMDEVGLVLIPRVTAHKVGESAIEYHDSKGVLNKRTITYFTEIDMTMTWVNAEKPDEVIECPWYAQGVDIAGEKGVGKALTYGEKYFILKQFNIPTDTDDPDMLQRQPRNESYSPPVGGKGKQDEQPPKSAPQPPSASTASEISTGQISMLHAKATAAGLTDKAKLHSIVSVYLNYEITSLDQIKKADVTKAAQFLDKQRKVS